MELRRLPSFALLAALLACVCSVSSAAGMETAAAAVRQADADWTAAGSSVDAWLSFYAPDAIGRLPGDRPASGREELRPAVLRLLAAHPTFSSRPLELQVAASADLAFLTLAYELRVGEGHAGEASALPASQRGRRLEIWRRQADGGWKCIVDDWSPDQPGAAPAASTPAAPAASTAAATPAGPRSSAAAAPAQPASAPPSAPAGAPLDAKYGAMPTAYEAAIRAYFQEHLKHPDSVQYREIAQPEQGSISAVVGGFLMSEKREYGWIVKATIDAKNSRDQYVGFKTYTFLFRGETIVGASLPLPGGEMN